MALRTVTYCTENEWTPVGAQLVHPEPCVRVQATGYDEVLARTAGHGLRLCHTAYVFASEFMFPIGLPSHAVRVRGQPGVQLQLHALICDWRISRRAAQPSPAEP